MASTINAKNTSTGVVITPDSSGQLELQTADTTRMTIDVNGNVGIGTSSPRDVSGYATLAINDTTGALFDLMAANSRIASLGADAGGLDLRTVTSSPAVFGTNNTERMRIDSNGDLLVGATSKHSSAGAARVYSSNCIAALSGYYCKAGQNATTFGNMFNINWTGSPQLWIDSTNVGTFAFTSDYRIKKNIETNATPALERIAQIRPVTYELADYKELFKEDGVQREGFIAHELQAVIPSAVDGEKDAEDQIQSLKLDALCSVMVKAIQEQQDIINNLKSRIEALEGA